MRRWAIVDAKYDAEANSKKWAADFTFAQASKAAAKDYDDTVKTLAADRDTKKSLNKEDKDITLSSLKTAGRLIPVGQQAVAMEATGRPIEAVQAQRGAEGEALYGSLDAAVLKEKDPEIRAQLDDNSVQQMIAFAAASKLQIEQAQANLRSQLVMVEAQTRSIVQSSKAQAYASNHDAASAYVADREAQRGTAQAALDAKIDDKQTPSEIRKLLVAQRESQFGASDEHGDRRGGTYQADTAAGMKSLRENQEASITDLVSRAAADRLLIQRDTFGAEMLMLKASGEARLKAADITQRDAVQQANTAAQDLAAEEHTRQITESTTMNQSHRDANRLRVEGHDLRADISEQDAALIAKIRNASPELRGDVARTAVSDIDTTQFKLNDVKGGAIAADYSALEIPMTPAMAQQAADEKKAANDQLDSDRLNAKQQGTGGDGALGRPASPYGPPSPILPSAFGPPSPLKAVPYGPASPGSVHAGSQASAVPPAIAVSDIHVNTTDATADVEAARVALKEKFRTSPNVAAERTKLHEKQPALVAAKKAEHSVHANSHARVSHPVAIARSSPAPKLANPLVTSSSTTPDSIAQWKLTHARQPDSIPHPRLPRLTVTGHGTIVERPGPTLQAAETRRLEMKHYGPERQQPAAPSPVANGGGEKSASLLKELVGLTQQMLAKIGSYQ